MSGKGGENVEPEAGNFIDVASVYRVYRIFRKRRKKMHSELVSVTYVTEGISMPRTAFMDLFAN